MNKHYTEEFYLSSWRILFRAGRVVNLLDSRLTCIVCHARIHLRNIKSFYPRAVYFFIHSRGIGMWISGTTRGLDCGTVATTDGWFESRTRTTRTASCDDADSKFEDSKSTIPDVADLHLQVAHL